MTTAPTEGQVKNQIWKQMRAQLGTSKDLGSGIDISGMRPEDPFWQMPDNKLHYAKGIATNTASRFRGDHSPNLFILIDEAEGVPKWVLDEADGMCVSNNNIIVMLGNPTRIDTSFYDACQPNSGWEVITLSCLDHPNVTLRETKIPGAVTWDWVDRHVKSNAIPLSPHDEIGPFDFEWPVGSAAYHHPDDFFMCRVLGEFPAEGNDAIVPVWALTQSMAQRQEIDPNTPVDIGADIARRGGDHTVVFVRRGPCVLKRIRWTGQDIDKTKRELAGLCKTYTLQGCPIGTIAIDAIGIGAGVADGLNRMLEEGLIHCDRVLAVQVSEKGANRETYSTIRDELAYAMGERAKSGQLDLTRLGTASEDFVGQATHIKRDYDHRNKLTYQSKDILRAEIGQSPDDFDAMCLAFMDTTDNFAREYAEVISSS
jgi:hypothetical protein